MNLASSAATRAQVFEILFLTKLGTIFFDQKQVRDHLDTWSPEARLALREGPLAAAAEPV